MYTTLSRAMRGREGRQRKRDKDSTTSVLPSDAIIRPRRLPWLPGNLYKSLLGLSGYFGNPSRSPFVLHSIRNVSSECIRKAYFSLIAWFDH